MSCECEGSSSYLNHAIKVYKIDNVANKAVKANRHFEVDISHTTQLRILKGHQSGLQPLSYC